MYLDKKKNFIINIFYYLVWLILAFLLFKLISVYFFPFVIGIIIAYSVQKPAVILSSKIKTNQHNCSAILSVSLFVLLVLFIAFIGWLLYLQLNEFAQMITNNEGEISDFLSSVFLKLEKMLLKSNDKSNNIFQNFFNDSIVSLISKISYIITNSVTSFVKRIPSFFIGVTITVVATYYMSKDYNRLVNFLKGIMDKENFNKIHEIKNIFFECCFKFIKGYFFLFIITLLELFIGFSLLKIRHSFLLSFLISMLDILPVVGTGTVLLPWAVLMLLKKEFYLGFGIIVLYITVTIFRNFIEPKIIGNQVEINPILSLVFIYIGFKFGGVFGMITLPIIFTVGFTYLRRKYLINDN